MLTVLYDDECAFCVRCREVFAGYEAIAPIRFVPLRSDEAGALGAIPGGGSELVVVSDQGMFWMGPSAFLACLWSFDETRWIASLLGLPLIRWVGACFFRFLSRNRGALSSLFGMKCEGHCSLPSTGSPYR